ncbi:MAG: AAA family ATPase [Deltaproteobacteria bacterium]|nr:AAA family ATPase [Deltaproteobacteria bacterium]MBW1719245.1 AAA family ATPase [Deltaproteobacteria bacterium]MBW1932276.1 AAA family ATPase [Deltaproteobacteria bacterium]MBW1937685.1 AAA family ATPase [Deltaproteobacteria bacterium]MBW1964235.1 AAA family ATPase [Deltaproteobacteria bacterium]
MYEDFFGLRERPFKLLPDPGYLFLSHQHRLALVHLEYGLLNKAGFVVITGEIGTGKTTLIKTLLQSLDRTTLVASVFNTTVDPDEFTSLVLQELEQEPAGLSRAEKIEQLNASLISCYARGQRVVLIVDEAQNLSFETLEEIRLFSNLQTDKDYLIQIILVGQPELRNKLSHPSLQQLAQRISVHYHLGPLNEEETVAYIRHRLNVSGGKDAEYIFSKEAMEIIYNYTKGTPRLINLLCDSCMVHGFADQIQPLTAGVVEDVIKGDDAGSFWALASTAASSSEDTGRHAADTPESMGKRGRLETLEKQVRQIVNGLVVLSRLVHERLLSDRIPTQGGGTETEKQLMQFLEEERAKVRLLEEQCKKQLEQIAELSHSSQELAGDADNVFNADWPES